MVSFMMLMKGQLDLRNFITEVFRPKAVSRGDDAP
jgi:hypothetical protein